MKVKLFSIVFFLAIFSSVLAQASPWVKKCPMPTARVGLCACLVDGKIYAIGGGTDVSTFVSTVEVYDPATDTWTTKKSMNRVNASFGAAAVNGKIYVIGGHKGQAGFSNVEMYDPATNTWTAKKSMQHARHGLGVCAVNGKIYAIGGCPSPGAPGTQYVEEYDPESDTWVEKANMLTKRIGLSTCVLDGKIYVIGGKDVEPDGTIHSTVEVYDPATNEWKKCQGKLPTARVHSSASQIDGKIYVFGGSLSPLSDPFPYVEVYDPLSDKWYSKSDMPEGRMFLSTCSVNGKIYLIGGTSAEVPFKAVSELLEYNPASDPTDVSEGFSQIPAKMELFQNYPNPFNPTTNFEFRIANSGFVSLRIFDLLGREVAALVNEEKPAGDYKIQFNGRNLTSGVYFYQLKSGNFISTKQFVLMK